MSIDGYEMLLCIHFRGVGKTLIGGAQYVINYFVVQNIYGTN